MSLRTLTWPDEMRFLRKSKSDLPRARQQTGPNAHSAEHLAPAMMPNGHSSKVVALKCHALTCLCQKKRCFLLQAASFSSGGHCQRSFLNASERGLTNKSLCLLSANSLSTKRAASSCLASPSRMLSEQPTQQLKSTSDQEHTHLRDQNGLILQPSRKKSTECGRLLKVHKSWHRIKCPQIIGRYFH